MACICSNPHKHLPFCPEYTVGLYADRTQSTGDALTLGDVQKAIRDLMPPAGELEKRLKERFVVDGSDGPLARLVRMLEANSSSSKIQALHEQFREARLRADMIRAQAAFYQAMIYGEGFKPIPWEPEPEPVRADSKVPGTLRELVEGAK